MRSHPVSDRNRSYGGGIKWSVSRYWIGAGLLAAIGGFALYPWSSAAAPSLLVTPSELAADGYSESTVTIRSGSVPKLTSPNRTVHIGKLRQSGSGAWTAIVRSSVAPGEAKLVVTSVDGQAEARLELKPFVADREPNGMPDALELDSAQDQLAFRRWFTFLAEAQFFQREASRPGEINDCAALIRYAYREALKNHDEVWAKDAKLPLIRAIPTVEKYNYPHTLLGPALFRVKEGSFQTSDAAAFSPFADAQTLQRFNARFISRDVTRALPGDLFFYRHDRADLPFHGMIYLGSSQVQSESQDHFLVYHTGPNEHDPGEIRRPTLTELLHHPNPEWRPVAGNPTFLGVFRWNILP